MNATPNNDRGSMSDLERVKERVRKLLAIAQDERANPHEAAAAAEQAEKVMRKFQIDHADIIEQEMKVKGGGLKQADVAAVMKRGLTGKTGAHKPASVPLWAGLLATAVARYHDCQNRQAYTEELGACIRFQGYGADVDMCVWTFDYLANAMIQSMRRYQSEGSRDKAESASYRNGFIMSLTSSLRTLRAAKEREMQQLSSSRGLVLVKSGAIAEHFGAVKYRTVKVGGSNGSAFNQGREEGRKVDVNRRGIGSSANNGAKRLG